MSRKSNWTRRIVGVLAATGAITGVAASLRPEPVPVQVSRVTRGALVVTVDGTARTRLVDKDTVMAPVVGEVEKLSLRAGDRVTKGQPIAVILPSAPNPLDDRTKAEIVARLGSAQASLSEAQRNVERAEIALELADREAERSRKLLAAHAIAPSELERAETEARARRSELELTRVTVERIRRESKVVAAPLQDPNTAAQKGRQHVEVRAPRAGVVLRVHQESAGPVQPGTPLIDIGDPRSLELVVELPTQSAMKVRTGAPVRVDGTGSDALLLGNVKLVEPAAFTRVTALGVEEQRVNVIVIPADGGSPWTTLGDGFAADAHIEVQKAADVQKIPVGALFRNGGRAQTFLVEAGRAKLVAIQVGSRSVDEVEVRSGLANGSLVVVHPSDKLMDGAPVRVE